MVELFANSLLQLQKRASDDWSDARFCKWFCIELYTNSRSFCHFLWRALNDHPRPNGFVCAFVNEDNTAGIAVDLVLVGKERQCGTQ